MKFDANLKWLFTELPFEDRFAAAAEAGFDAVEFAAPYPYEVADLRHRLRDNDLELVLINTPAGPADTPFRSGYACLPDQVQQFREGISRALEYATALDSSYIHVMAGMRPTDVSEDRAFARFVANIDWAAEQAAGSGVRLLLEAQNQRSTPNCILNSQSRAAAVVEAVGRDRAGVMFDLFHAQVNEGDLITTINTLQDVTLHYQVADVPGRNEPGTGEIAYDNVFQAISATGYEGWIGCEYAPASTTAEGLSWIERYTHDH